MAKILLGRWEQLAKAAHYNVRELARLCYLSVRQLERDFNCHLGRSPQRWLNEQRLKEAQKRLLAGDPVKKVAFELGFKQPSHFCRQFKLWHHATPSQFVARAQTVPICRS